MLHARLLAVALLALALGGCSDPQPAPRPGVLTVAPAAGSLQTEDISENGMPTVLREALEEMAGSGLAAQRYVTGPERQAIEDYFEFQEAIDPRMGTYSYRGHVFRWSILDSQ